MHKPFFLCCVVAVIPLLALFSHADEKKPVPSEREQAEVMELLKEIYGDQMASRDAGIKKNLAADLLKEAGNPANDAASRYVLLTLAANAGAEAGDPHTALEAIAKMERLYRTRTSNLRMQVLSQSQRSAREPEEFAVVAHGYADLVMAAIREDNYEVARQAAQQGLSVAMRTRDQAFIAPFRDLRGTVNDAQRVYQTVAPSFQALQSNPDNPEANLAVGRYLAFLKGDWSEGLPHLAKGSDREIAAAAHTDLGAPQEAESRLALGNAWYAIAERESNENMKNGIILRAAEHYRSVIPTLEGLAKRRIEVRIGEADAIAEAAMTGLLPESASPQLGRRHASEVRRLEQALGYRLGRRPNGAVEFQGRWYQLIQHRMTWEQAQARCQELGGFLMIVDSQEKQDFAVKLANGQDTWIGLRRVPHGGRFFWMDGSEPEFAAWAPGEPNNHGGREHWVHLWGGEGLWNDHNESFETQFICEWVR